MHIIKLTNVNYNDILYNVNVDRILYFTREGHKTTTLVCFSHDENIWVAETPDEITEKIRQAMFEAMPKMAMDEGATSTQLDNLKM